MNSPTFAGLNWTQYFPSATRLALKPIPDRLLQEALSLSLNRSFRPYIRQGDLDFLKSRWVMINVTDIALCFRATLTNAQLVVDMKSQHHDVCFTSNVSDLLLVIAGKVDPDTLFFRRRLMITGDTELGLSLKNFLDTLEPKDLLPGSAFKLLEKFAAQSN